MSEARERAECVCLEGVYPRRRKYWRACDVRAPVYLFVGLYVVRLPLLLKTKVLGYTHMQRP